MCNCRLSQHGGRRDRSITFSFFSNSDLYDKMTSNVVPLFSLYVDFQTVHKQTLQALIAAHLKVSTMSLALKKLGVILGSLLISSNRFS